MFRSSEDICKKREMYLKSENRCFMVDILTNKMIKVLYDPPFTIIKETYLKI